MAKNKRRGQDRKPSPGPERAQARNAPPVAARAAAPAEAADRPGRHPIFLMAAAMLLVSWLLFLIAMAVAR
jgi:hypothetical protein